MDGSSFSMSDRPELQEIFGQPGNRRPGCGFPVAHILALFQVGTGLLQRVTAAPLRTHDMAHAAVLHSEMSAGDILVADRGFASYAHLSLVFQRNLHAVFRCHQQQIVSFRAGRRHTGQRRPQAGLPRSRWLRRLGRHDQLVEYAKPRTRPQWLSAEALAALPDTLTIRELRYTVARPGRHHLGDRLARPGTLSRRRAGRPLRTALADRNQPAPPQDHDEDGSPALPNRQRRDEGTGMFALAYNLVRLVMLEASRRQEVPVDRISFIDALGWLRTAEPGTPLPDLIVNPRRPDRFEPRVVKRRPKEYDRMTQPRSQLRNNLLNQPLAA
jgi:Transposase DDE domain